MGKHTNNTTYRLVPSFTRGRGGALVANWQRGENGYGIGSGSEGNRSALAICRAMAKHSLSVNRTFRYW